MGVGRSPSSQWLAQLWSGDSTSRLSFENEITPTYLKLVEEGKITSLPFGRATKLLNAAVILYTIPPDAPCSIRQSRLVEQREPKKVPYASLIEKAPTYSIDRALAL